MALPSEVTIWPRGRSFQELRMYCYPLAQLSVKLFMGKLTGVCTSNLHNSIKCLSLGMNFVCCVGVNDFYGRLRACTHASAHNKCCSRAQKGQRNSLG